MQMTFWCKNAQIRTNIQLQNLTKKKAPNYKTAQNMITKLRSLKITKLRKKLQICAMIAKLHKIITNLRNN